MVLLDVYAKHNNGSAVSFVTLSVQSGKLAWLHRAVLAVGGHAVWSSFHSVAAPCHYGIIEHVLAVAGSQLFTVEVQIQFNFIQLGVRRGISFRQSPTVSDKNESKYVSQ